MCVWERCVWGRVLERICVCERVFLRDGAWENVCFREGAQGGCFRECVFKRICVWQSEFLSGCVFQRVGVQDSESMRVSLWGSAWKSICLRECVLEGRC